MAQYDVYVFRLKQRLTLDLLSSHYVILTNRHESCIAGN